MRYTLIPLLLISATFLFAQTENCTNGIDDDGDGLIDCFDTECGCTGPCTTYYYNTCPTSCFYHPPCNQITLGLDWTGDAETGTYGTIVAGDLDSDGVPEVVTYNCEQNQLYIINGANGQTKRTIMSPSRFRGGTSPALADLDNDGFGEIVIVSEDIRLRCYDHLGNLKWTSADLVGYDLTYGFSSPNIADFDHDGLPEINIGNEVFNGQTGAKLASGGAALSAGEHPARKGGGFSFNATVVADVLPDNACPDCQGLEIIAGNMVLAVNLTTGIVTKVNQVPAAYSDGFTSLADIDLDGDLDAIVQGRKNGWNTVYAWDLQTPAIIGEYRLLNNWDQGASRVNIADMNNDGQLEMNFISYPQMYTLRSNFTVLWLKQNDDVSAVTSSSVFDFCGDGSADILYRGQTKLQVLEGATGQIKWQDDCLSATHIECPLVLDVDADGQTEVVISCGMGSVNSGRVMSYETINTPGIPSRPVWNQHAYFSTNIENNLRVPRYQQNPHLIADGVKMNGFMNQYFNPTFPAPDGSIDILGQVCVRDSISIQVEVCNIGQNVLPANTPVSFYRQNPTAAGATWFFTTSTGKTLPFDSCTTVTLMIPRVANVQVYAVLNDNASLPVPYNLDQQFPVTTIGECNFMNNMDSMFLDYAPKTLVLSKDTLICDNATLSFNIQDPYIRTYAWQDGTSSPSFTAIDAGTFYFTTTDICNIIQTDTIKVGIDSSTVIHIGADETLCKGEQFTRTVSGFDQYLWQPFADASCGTCGTTHITPTTSGKVILIGRLNNGCWSSDTLQVTVHDTSYQVIDTTICYGNEVNVNGFTIQPDSTKLFALQSRFGCDSTVVYRVKGTFLGTYQTQVDTNICKGSTLTYAGITLNDNTTYQFRFSAQTGCDSTVTIKTNPLDTFLTQSSRRICFGDVAQIFGAPQSQSGIYARRFIAANGCDSTHYITLSVAPSISLDISSEPTCPNEENGTLTIDVQGGTPPYQYAWDDPSLQGSNLTSLEAGNYQLTITDELACTETITATVLAHPDMVWEAEAIDPNCHNETTGKVRFLSADSTLLFSFETMPFSSSNQIPGLGGGVYSVRAQDIYGCLEQQTITLINPAQLTVGITQTDKVLLGDSIVLEAISNTNLPLQYQWSPALYLNCDSCPAPLAKPLYPVRYTLHITDSKGCKASSQQLIDVNRELYHYAPNVFTPGGKDLENTGFMPYFGLSVQEVLRFQVFDRWGNVQFTARQKFREDPTLLWDGRAKGKPANPDVYVWSAHIRLIDGTEQVLHGDVALIR